jgi:hypothetical protein
MALIDKLTAIGNAIREKNGTSDLIPLADMPQAILDIASGGGVSYTSIVYNDDDTITLIDKDGITHTMVCTYEDDKLIGVNYDGKAINIGYENNKMYVGKTEINLSDAKTSAVPQLTAEAITTFIMTTSAYEEVVTDA